MAGKWRVTLSGDKKLAEKLRSMNVKVSDAAILRVLIRAGQIISEQAKRMAPHPRIRKAIRIKPFQRQIPHSPAAFIAIDWKVAPDAYWWEYGTQPRFQKKTKRFTGAMPARPFFRPARDANRTRVRKAIRDGITQLIEEVESGRGTAE